MRTASVLLSVVAATLLFSSARVLCQDSASRKPDALFPSRAYKVGEILRYVMTGTNHGWQYQVEADDVVKVDETGKFYEQIGWSNLHSNAPFSLSPGSLSFRQKLSMTAASDYLKVPNLATVQPFLIGPITDMLTFYVDVFAVQRAKLTSVGQHAYVPHGEPNSWADGQHILLGQDSIDFDVTLVENNKQDHSAVLLIHHVAPTHPQIKLPAPWMRMSVDGAPNNWVQVERSGEKYIAQVGHEIFDVKITLDTLDGKIVSVQLHNPVVAVSRECTDAGLTVCNPQIPETIVRDVTLNLLP